MTDFTTELGDGYDQPNEAVKETVEHLEGHGPPPHTDPHDHPGEHWTDLQFVYLAIALAVITALEVWASYADLGAFFIPLLIVLMLIKFFSVVLFFMHLHFDNRWFSILFYMGMVLAVGVYIVTMFTFQFFVK
jgi:cytochrome c oxidase subunit 4